MTAAIPLSILVPQILLRTPTWVWGLLVLLLGLGVLQMRERVAGAARLAIAPLALGALSLWGAVSAFGARPAVVTAWLAGVGAMFAIFAGVAALRRPQPIERRGSGFVVPGSVWPLVLMLVIFALRYVVNVALVLDPAGAHQASFALPMAMLYGALSGFFAARVWRIVAAGRGAVAGLALVTSRR